MAEHGIHEAQVTFRFVGPYRDDIRRRLEELLEDIHPKLYGMVEECIHDGPDRDVEDCPECSLPDMPGGDVFIRWAEYVDVER